MSKPTDTEVETQKTYSELISAVCITFVISCVHCATTTSLFSRTELTQILPHLHLEWQTYQRELLFLLSRVTALATREELLWSPCCCWTAASASTGHCTDAATLDTLLQKLVSRRCWLKNTLAHWHFYQYPMPWMGSFIWQWRTISGTNLNACVFVQMRNFTYSLLLLWIHFSSCVWCSPRTSAWCWCYRPEKRKYFKCGKFQMPFITVGAHFFTDFTLALASSSMKQTCVTGSRFFIRTFCKCATWNERRKFVTYVSKGSFNLSFCSLPFPQQRLKIDNTCAHVE